MIMAGKLTINSHEHQLNGSVNTKKKLNRRVEKKEEARLPVFREEEMGNRMRREEKGNR
jgi:hypothetical protein